MKRFIVIRHFGIKRGSIGIPKIAACAELVSVLRKSGTKTLKKICGLWLN
jgi:hypothetical protein